MSRLLQETASRVNSVASTAPGSTRLGQGLAAPKKWMKLDAQGVVSYIKAKLPVLTDNTRSSRRPFSLQRWLSG